MPSPARPSGPACTGPATARLSIPVRPSLLVGRGRTAPTLTDRIRALTCAGHLARSGRDVGGGQGQLRLDVAAVLDRQLVPGGGVAGGAQSVGARRDVGELVA